MAAFRKLVAVYLVALGAFVAGHFVLQAFYSGDVALDMWTVLDWFIAVALVLTLAIALHEKRYAGHESDAPVTRSWITANVALYATYTIGLLFFYNWFQFEWNGNSDDPQLWILIDVAVAILFVSTGARAWRAGPRVAAPSQGGG